jgi:NADP-dependent 3-hydroxy acid dehydrogenase YdfG
MTAPSKRQEDQGVSSQESLAGRVVVVAGASSGMGRATARSLAAAGVSLVLAARSGDALSALASEISDAGGAATAFVADVVDAQAAADLVRAALERHGRIDALVNTVGTNIPRRRLDELTSESWRELIDVNLTAAFNLTRAVVPALRANGGGQLVHISSSAAKRADQSGVGYQASKAGVAALAHGTMEEERANNIRVSVIYPGLTDTPLVLKRPTPTPPDVLAKALQPEDVAAACLFILGLPARAWVPELLLYPSAL